MVSDDRGAPKKCPVADITGHSLRTGRKVATSSGGAAASKSTLAFRGCFERDSYSRGQPRKVHPKYPVSRSNALRKGVRAGPWRLRPHDPEPHVRVHAAVPERGRTAAPFQQRTRRQAPRAPHKPFGVGTRTHGETCTLQ